MRSNFRGNERMVPHIRVHLLDVRFCWVVYLEKKVKVMSKFESNVQYIKYLVNRECASRFFNGELDKEINMEKEIAEAIIPGPKASFRCCIYKERAIINSRVKLAMGGDKSNPCLVEVLPIACDECPVTEITVGPSCRGCLWRRHGGTLQYLRVGWRWQHVGEQRHSGRTMTQNRKCAHCPPCVAAYFDFSQKSKGIICKTIK